MVSPLKQVSLHTYMYINTQIYTYASTHTHAGSIYMIRNSKHTYKYIMHIQYRLKLNYYTAILLYDRIWLHLVTTISIMNVNSIQLMVECNSVPRGSIFTTCLIQYILNLHQLSWIYCGATSLSNDILVTFVNSVIHIV